MRIIKIFGVIVLVAIISFSLLTCKEPNQTPVASDYTVGNLSQVAGNVTAVTIIANSGKSSGVVSNIRYNDSTTIPQTSGIYAVTFDVAVAPGWSASNNLSAGNLVVGYQTPVASDYTIGNLSQTAGSVTAVTITVNNGKSPGVISNIRYNGSTTIPQTSGIYIITFDVAAATDWNSATGLSAGNLVISNQTPVANDYTISNLLQIAGSVTAVVITAKSGKSPGTIGNIHYNGSTTIPQTNGTYAVTFDISAASGWNAATVLSAGNLIVDNQTPVASDYTFGNLSQTAESVIAVTIMANSGKSTGAISNIRYNSSTTIPQTSGTYAVTFDVAATTGWNSALGLSAGNLIVNNKTPVASDFIIGNLNQISENITPVNVTPIAGASNGTITILYNSSSTLPTAAGSYIVTFNVAASTGWNAATGLAGGTLIITDFTGIVIGNSTVRLFLNNNTTPLLDGGSTIIDNGTGTYSLNILPGVYSEIIWYLNGTVVSQGTTNTSLVLTKRNSGIFHVTVEATAAGEKNTGNHFFVVQ
ncbi:MAG: MBG domain-containing protein [Treponema sp.]|nr:MBG domain-containing protein [Treponema sp.]